MASPEQRAFVGRIWISTDSSAAPGTMRIFLADGGLVMDSCAETYRLAQWTTIDDQRIGWEEDGARIEAEVTRATSDELQLRLRLANEVKEENYRLARVPYVCPDSRPDPAASVARGIVTPSPTTYRCGTETFKVAFEQRRAYVTMPDGSLVTLERQVSGDDPGQPHTFSNGRLTFVQEAKGTGGPRVLFARGRMAPVTCTRQD